MGTLQQFLGLMDYEQVRTGFVGPGYEDPTVKIHWPGKLYGPIMTDRSGGSSCYWLVVNNYYSWFLNSHEKGERGTSVAGPMGTLVCDPDSTLEDYDRAARKQGSSLSRILGTAELWATELPGRRLRIIFRAGRSESPSFFWKWADDFIAEIERHGFRQQSTGIPMWLTKQAPEETETSLHKIVQFVEDWIPKQRFTKEEAYEAALAEHLVGKGVPAPEQQGASLVDILAANGIGIELKLNPDRNEYNRLSGQIMRHLEQYGVVIVLILRADNRDLLEEYQSRFDDRVVFIVKG